MQPRLYLYVKAFSDLGTMMEMIVLTAMVLGQTHSVMWVSANLGALTLGGLLSSLSSGGLADRLDRRRLMMFADWVRAACVLLPAAYPKAQLIVMVSFLIGFFNTYFSVSFSASVPVIFGADRALETNALISRLGAISMVAGFLLAGGLSRGLGYSAVLMIDSLTYITSAVTLMTMRWTSPANGPGQAPYRRLRLSTDVREVMGYLRTRPAMLILFCVYLIETFGASSHNLGIPLLARQLNPTNQPLVYGLIWGTWGVGNVFATAWLPKLRHRIRRVYVVYGLSAAATSLGFICVLSADQLRVVLPLALLTGIFDAVTGTLYAVIVQSCDDFIRGRVMGISSLANRFGFGTGFIVAPMVLASSSLPVMVRWFHGTAILATLLAVLFWTVRAKDNVQVAAAG